VRRAAAAAGAVALALVLAGCGSSDPSTSPVANVSIQDDDGLNGVVLPKPYTAPSVTLQDGRGGTYDPATDAKKPLTLVFFGYTHCPDICQVVMATVASALTRLDDGERAKVAMEFVTTDPARDTREVVRRYAARFDPSFDGLTGDLPTIVRFAKAFGVPIQRGTKLASGGYDVTHGTQVVGLRPDGTAPFVWTQGTDPASLTQDIQKILEDKVPGL